MPYVTRKYGVLLSRLFYILPENLRASKIGSVLFWMGNKKVDIKEVLK